MKDMKTENSRVVKLPMRALHMFGATTGQVLLATATHVILYDLAQRQEVASCQAANVKYVSWSPDGSLLTLLGKHTILVVNKQLEQQCIIHETIRIKSGIWDKDGGIFMYSTLNHIKYALSNGYPFLCF